MTTTLRIRTITRSPEPGPERYSVCQDGVPGTTIVVSALGYAGAARKFLKLGVTAPVSVTEDEEIRPWRVVTVEDRVLEEYRLGWPVPHVEPVQPAPADDLPLEEPADHDHHDPATCPVCRAPGHRILVPRYVCPVCKTPTDAARCQTGDFTPEAGDLSVCSTCGDVSEFVVGLSRQPVDRAKLTELVRENPRLKVLVRLAKGIRLGYLDRLTR